MGQYHETIDASPEPAENETNPAVRLVPITPATDAVQVHRLINESPGHMFFFDFGSADFSTVVSTQEYLEERCSDGSAFSIRSFGQMAGNLYISDHEAPELSSLSYWVAKRYTRQGIGTEAVRQAINFSFTNLGKGGLLAGVALNNEPSVALLNKLGFVRVQKETLDLEAGQTAIGIFALANPDYPDLESLISGDA